MSTYTVESMNKPTEQMTKKIKKRKTQNLS